MIQNRLFLESSEFLFLQRQIRGRKYFKFTRRSIVCLFAKLSFSPRQKQIIGKVQKVCTAEIFNLVFLAHCMQCPFLWMAWLTPLGYMSQRVSLCLSIDLARENQGLPTILGCQRSFSSQIFEHSWNLSLKNPSESPCVWGIYCLNSGGVAE